MGVSTAIAWTATVHQNGKVTQGATWNPWLGCHKKSPGCKNCYMYRDMPRYGRDPNVVVRSAKSTFDSPITWEKTGKLPPGSKIFTCSWSDWFIEEADPWRDEAWQIIKDTPEYNYLILTKRVENIRSRLPKDWDRFTYRNVWLGMTTENQEMFDKRIDEFISIPAYVRFLSIEPMLSPISILRGGINIHWVIVGGESDRKAPRPMQESWVRDIIKQCGDLSIPFFMKQYGSWYAKEYGMRSWKGDDPEEWPMETRLRHFPVVDIVD